MYIEPNSNVHLLSNVPLDNKYNHTLWFDNVDRQISYFGSRVVKSFRKCTYQRDDRGWLRVGEPMRPVTPENSYNCNYLMFQNTNFGDKWFYAFITRIEYLNNTVAQIYYQIDVLQTWFFDYQLGESYVVREHTNNDSIGLNLVDENLELGEYTSDGHWEFDMMPLNLCALTSESTDGSSPTPRTINGVYTPLNVIAGLPVTDTASINEVLNYYLGAGQGEKIINIYEYPAFLGDANTENPVVRTLNIPFMYDDIDGYEPKNNKLFTYPYNFISVSNNSGQIADYKYELFDTPFIDDGVQFNITGTFVTTPCVLAYPSGYNGKAANYDAGITYSDFPNCAWVNDVYKAYMAQNKNAIASSILSSTVGTAFSVGFAVTNPLISVGGAIGALATRQAGINATSQLTNYSSNVFGTIAKLKDLKSYPDQVKGQVQCESLNAGLKRIKFDFYRTCIKSQFAKIIDEYFSMFGYATHRVKEPNRNVRERWTFTQTMGCVIHGNIPQDDMSLIADIYDNGITFWKNADDIGKYHLSNNTIG